MNYNFNLTQDVLVQYAGTIVGHLSSDLADFTAFDGDLNQDKVDQMNAIIEWFLAEGGDQSVKSNLAERTAAVMAELTACRRLYNQLRYWVIKSFADNKTIQRTFGIGRISRIADNQSQMVLFMSALHQQVAKHRTALEDTGAPAALLDEVAVRAEALREANEAQEMMKGSRTVDTSNRVNQLNELFLHTRHFNTAAEYVYFDDPAKRDLYRPPSKTDSANVIPEVESPEHMS